MVIEIRCTKGECWWNLGEGGCAAKDVTIKENQSLSVSCEQFITNDEAMVRLQEMRGGK